MDNAHGKRMKVDFLCPGDRISELPDPIIHHIFSFLETETIVSTSILSKRWRHIWTMIPNFDFTFLLQDHQNLGTKGFQNFIDRLLFIRQPFCKMIKFALRSDRVFDASKVHEWILNLIKCNIEELSLNLCLDKPLHFPDSLFNCESLVELRLHLKNISLHLPKSISLPKLKLLQLSDLCFLDKLLAEQLIVNSPLLETLILSKCSWSDWNETTLNISAPALKYLLFDDADPLTYIGMRNGTVKIHAPKLMRFTYTGNIAVDYTVSSFSSIEDAEICFKIGSFCLETMGSQIGHAASKLVGGFSNVRSLVISGEALEALSFASDDLPTFQNLIHVRVTSEFKCFADKVLLKLFHSAPVLESLVFDRGFAMRPSDMGNSFWMQGMALECPLPQLKSVLFKETTWFLREVDLMKLILRNAENLEKMTFDDFTFTSSSSVNRILKAREDFGMILRATAADDDF